MFWVHVNSAALLVYMCLTCAVSLCCLEVCVSGVIDVSVMQSHCVAVIAPLSVR